MTLKMDSRGVLKRVKRDLSGPEWTKGDSQIVSIMLHKVLLNLPGDKLRLVKKTEELRCFGVKRHNPAPSANSFYPK